MVMLASERTLVAVFPLPTVATTPNMKALAQLGNAFGRQHS
jgi:hypothetical protein